MNDAHATQIAEVQTAVAAAANEDGQSAAEAPAVKIKASVLKKAQELAAEFAASDRQYASRNIEYATDSIKRELEKAAKAEEVHREKAAKWALAWTLLEKAGFEPTRVEWQRWRIRVTTEEKKLAKLARVIGQLDMENCEKQKAAEPGAREDAPFGALRIVAYAKEYDFVYVVWEHVLKATDRCKIVTRTVTEVECETRDTSKK